MQPETDPSSCIVSPVPAWIHLWGSSAPDVSKHPAPNKSSVRHRDITRTIWRQTYCSYKWTQKICRAGAGSFTKAEIRIYVVASFQQLLEFFLHWHNFFRYLQVHSFICDIRTLPSVTSIDPFLTPIHIIIYGMIPDFLIVLHFAPCNLTAVCSVIIWFSPSFYVMWNAVNS